MAVLATGVGLGCGARTDPLELDEQLGGGGGVAGVGRGGTTSAGSGGRNVGGSTAGFAGFGGTSFGGFGAVGNFGGFGNNGGTGFGGFGAVAGFGGFAGFAGFGAVGNFGGFAGEGGGHPECQALAGNACGQCACNTCYDPLVNCVTNAGCAAIFTCVAASGCQAFDCYQPSTCKGVIDQFGGLGGPSVRSAIGLVSCIATTGCSSCGL